MDFFASCEFYLDQADRVLERLTAEQYSSPHAHCYGGTVGGHVRHCLEHFESFATGLPVGAIDYDARERDELLEADPAAARREISSVREFFAGACRAYPYETRVRVKVDCGGPACGADDPSLWQDSTVGREAQFLVSHTVHHFAIIGIMCRSLGVNVEPDFGVAPSTLKHRERSA